MRIIIFAVLILIQSIYISAKDLPVRFYVANHKAECTGVGKQMCYLIKDSPNGTWQYYYNEIEGFNYEEGFDYEILVNKKTIDNPPADGPSFVYQLSEIVKKTPTMVISAENRNKLSMNEYILNRIRVNDEMQKPEDGRNVNIKFILNDNTVSGKDGCNSFSGNVIINNDSISFSNLALTSMMCLNVTIDKIFQQLIGKVNRYMISENDLMLYDGENLLLEYRLKENIKN